MKYLILAFALILTACDTTTPASTGTKTTTATSTASSTSTATAVNPDPGPVVYAADWSNPAYTKALVNALDVHGKALLSANPADMDTYCPNYAKRSWTERKRAWVMMISALARFESGFKPEVTYTEAFADSSGKKVISRGLLQISQESANGYGCGIKDAKQLHDVQTNLSCGVRILNKWVVQDGVVSSKGAPWKGAPRYWSPFRKVDRTNAIRAKVKQVCK